METRKTENTERLQREIRRIVAPYFLRDHPDRKAFIRESHSRRVESISPKLRVFAATEAKGTIPYFPSAYNEYLRSIEDAKALIKRKPFNTLSILHESRLERDARRILSEKTMTKQEYKEWYYNRYGKFASIRNERRINEDGVYVGDDWMIVSDGASGYLTQNVSGILGHVGATIANEMLSGLQRKQANEDEIVRAMNDFPFSIIEQLQQSANALVSEPGMREQLLNDSVASASIAFYAPWLGKVFLGHIGDVRAYMHIRLDDRTKVIRLTTDQNTPRNRKALSHFIQPGEEGICREGYTVSSLAVEPGDVIVSVTDGLFDTVRPTKWERDDIVGDRVRFGEYLQGMIDHVGIGNILLEKLIMDAKRRQMVYEEVDDISVGIMEIQ